MSQIYEKKRLILMLLGLGFLILEGFAAEIKVLVEG